jgi:hypothetical protein
LLVAANGSTPYTNSLVGGKRQDVPFPGSWYVTEFQPYPHTLLTDIEDDNGIISFLFTNTTTGISTPSTSDINWECQWYNIMGQAVDIRQYHGIVISKQGKVLIR